MYTINKDFSTSEYDDEKFMKALSALCNKYGLKYKRIDNGRPNMLGASRYLIEKIYTVEIKKNPTYNKIFKTASIGVVVGSIRGLAIIRKRLQSEEYLTKIWAAQYMVKKMNQKFRVEGDHNTTNRLGGIVQEFPRYYGFDPYKGVKKFNPFKK